MIYRFIYFPLIHRALYCFPQNTPRRSTVTLISVFRCNKDTLAVLDKFLAGFYVSNKVYFQNYFADKLIRGHKMVRFWSPPKSYVYTMRLIGRFLVQMHAKNKEQSVERTVGSLFVLLSFLISCYTFESKAAINLSICKRIFSLLRNNRASSNDDCLFISLNLSHLGVALLCSNTLQGIHLRPFSSDPTHQVRDHLNNCWRTRIRKTKCA